AMRGKPIDVRCFSNCDEVELFVNHCSRGRKQVIRNSHVAWKIEYEPGVLEAIGFRARRPLLHKQIETCGAPAQIALSPDRWLIRADGCDVAAVTVWMADSMNRPVPTADNLIRFAIKGPGRILGVGNGDPSSHESDKALQRRLFNGLAMVLVQSTG